MGATEFEGVPSMKGMTITAWSAEAYNSTQFDESIGNVASLNANWVTFTVFWFMDNLTDTEIRRMPDLYTSSDSSLLHAVQKAHDLGLNVSLKPMVDIAGGGWRGDISPKNWTLWFQNYRSFTNYYATFSAANDVELLVIGTELRSSQSHTQEWRRVINETRNRFPRNLTYAANWDSYGIGSVGFWDALDYVGVDAYFPLTNSYNPSVAQLADAWAYCTAQGWWETGRNWTSELYSTYVQTGKKIVFTEIGYYSQNGTNMQPWTGFNPPNAIDLQEQADCYQAALEVFKTKSWFMGWFWWNWETDPNAGGSSDNWYPPQNKPAEQILRRYYSYPTIVFQATGVMVPVTVNLTCEGLSGSLAIPVEGSNSTSIPYGSRLDFAFSTPVNESDGVRYILNATLPTSPLVNVTSNTTVTGQYKTQYFLAVNSDRDSPVPQSGWFDNSSFINASVTSPSYGLVNSTRFACMGWTGTGNVPASGTASNTTFTMNQPSSITWNWRTQYLLGVHTYPVELEPKPTANPVGDTSGLPGHFWYDSATEVNVTAQPVTGYVFDHWNVDNSSRDSGVNQITVAMSVPHDVTAYYTPETHDVALTNVALSKVVVGQGYNLTVNVTAANEGDFPEALNVTVYANTTVIATQINVPLTIGESTVLSYGWNTSGTPKGNYVICAFIDVVASETDTDDNTLVGGLLYVGTPGDVNADGRVDVEDVYKVARAYGSEPQLPNWNLLCDINDDGYVDVTDYYVVCMNYGKVEQ